MATQYQALIKRGLGKDSSVLTLNQVFEKFIKNPNDLKNNRELS